MLIDGSFLPDIIGYLDPGTGSIILQAIIGFIVATIAAVSFYWNKFKMFILKIFKKEKKSEKD